MLNSFELVLSKLSQSLALVLAGLDLRHVATRLITDVCHIALADFANSTVYRLAKEL